MARSRSLDRNLRHSKTESLNTLTLSYAKPCGIILYAYTFGGHTHRTTPYCWEKNPLRPLFLLRYVRSARKVTEIEERRGGFVQVFRLLVVATAAVTAPTSPTKAR